MNGFLKGLKSLVVEEDGKTAPPPAAPEPQPAQPQWGAPKPAAVLPAWGSKQPTVQRAAPAPEPSPVDPAIRQLLEKDINEAAKPAFSEFTVASDALADLITDERTRFQAAMKTTIARGQPREQVLVDIDECIQALDKKEAESNKNAEAARKQKVGAKQNRLAEINTKLQQLHDEITGAELERDRLQEEIQKDTEAIEQTKAAFSSTVAQYRQDLLDRKSKIESLTSL